MKSRQLFKTCLASMFLIGAVAKSDAATVGVDPGATWLGFMNWSPTPQNPGSGTGASGWGTADLNASFTGSTLTLSPNTIGDPDPYWYVSTGNGSVGNKIMEANMYVQPADGTFSGQTLTFTGFVLANTLLSSVNPAGNGWTAIAFIRDFAPDYSSFTTTTTPLVNGVFSISHVTDANPARHVQYGFQTVGPNVWGTDTSLAGYGNIQITAVPEPTSMALAGLGAALLFIRRRK